MFAWDSNKKVESLTVELEKHYVLFPGPEDDVRCGKTKRKRLGSFKSRNKWKLFNGQNKDPHGCLPLSTKTFLYILLILRVKAFTF